jgi:hypothetical protein
MTEDEAPDPELNEYESSVPAPSDDETELQELLSQMTTLQVANVFIERHAEELPTPGPGQDTTLTAMALLGQRAKSLYANLQYSLGSPAEIGPVLAVRPLVELVILAKWITLDPELHMFLYVADSDAAELAHMDDVREHAKDRGSSIPKDSKDATPIKEATRDAAFAKLKELGKNYGKDRVLPNLRRMANEVISKEPGHKIVMNDAYVYAYKTFSPWEHTDASSFKATASETAPNEWKWVGDKSPWHPEDIEAIATSMYAYVLETVFAAIGDDDNALFARKLCDFVFLKFVRSDRVQPLSSLQDVGVHGGRDGLDVLGMPRALVADPLPFVRRGLAGDKPDAVEDA